MAEETEVNVVDQQTADTGDSSPKPHSAEAASLDALRQEVKAQRKQMDHFQGDLVERERRLVRVLLDLFMRPDQRRAALKALLWCLLGATPATVGFGLTAVVGIYLAWQANNILVRQNALLDEQNRKIDAQLYIADSSRPSPSAVEYAAVMDALIHQKIPQSARLASGEPNPAHYAFQIRVANLLRSLRPSRTLEMPFILSMHREAELEGDANQSKPVVSSRFRSAERGWLLRCMPTHMLEKMPEYVSDLVFDFSYADMRGIRISGCSFKDVDVQASDWSGCQAAPNPEYEPAEQGWLPAVCFDNANLRGALFADAVLSYASFEQSDLRESNFTNAGLYNSKFDDAKLTGAVFEGARVGYADSASDTWNSLVEAGIDTKRWMVKEEIVQTKYRGPEPMWVIRKMSND